MSRSPSDPTTSFEESHKRGFLPSITTFQLVPPILVAIAFLLGTVVCWRDVDGLIRAPFGDPSVLLVSLLATIPLSASVSIVVVQRIGRGLSLAIAGMALVGSWALARTTDLWAVSLLDAGPAWADSLLRAGVALAWTGPCVLVAASWPSRSNRAIHPLTVALSVALAVLPPAAFIKSRVDHLSERTTDAIRRQLTGDAYQGLRQLRALGAELTLLGRDVPVLLEDHARQIRQMRRFLEQTQAAIDPTVRLRRGEFLARLGRHEEAEKVLEPLAATDLDAQLLLASSAQTRRLWDRSTQAYARVLTRSLARLDLPDPPNSWMPAPATLGDDASEQHERTREAIEIRPERAREACRRSLEGLAYNALNQQQWDRAEAIYRWASRIFPERDLEYTYRIGLLQYDAGNSGEARAYLRRALPGLPAVERARAEQVLTRIGQETPSCLLPTPGRRRAGWSESN